MSDSNPIAIISADRQRAREKSDPLVDLCFLATVGPDGAPAVRTLVLREIRDNRFTLFLNKTSPKWRDLERAPEYQMLLYYPTLARQYRLSGTIEEIDASRVRPDWNQRPAIAKYLDHFYEEVLAQSSAAPSRDWLTEQIEEMKRRSPEVASLQATASAAGIDCVVTRVDMLDIATDGGLHDRRLYALAEGIWSVRSLVP